MIIGERRQHIGSEGTTRMPHDRRERAIALPLDVAGATPAERLRLTSGGAR